MRLLGLAQRSPRQEGNVVFFAIIHYEVRLAIGEAVAVLYRDNRHDPAGALDVFARDVGEPHMANLALLAQFGQRFHGCLEGDGIIRSVELMNIDPVQAQAFETTFQRFGEVFGAGVVRPLARAWTLPSTFSRDDQI